jgi:hypothetical protein
MTDAFSFQYPSPLNGYGSAPSLPNEVAEDGKSLKNPPAETRSGAYDEFPAPLDNGNRGGL